MTYNLIDTSACIITSKISDHFPYLLSININHTQTPVNKYIYANNISSDSLNNFKTEIRSENLNEKISADLTSDPNTNYRIIGNVLTKAKQNNLSRKKVKFNKFEHAKSEWIIAGIIKSIKRRDTLYRNLKNTPTNSLDYEQRKINLRTLNVILKRSIFIAKKTYYHSFFTKYAFNIKKHGQL